jgi:selenide,water dikinase
MQKYYQFKIRMENVRLTQFSPGAGCGCKISPKDLDEILESSSNGFIDKMLLVGNESKDDAAVYDIGNEMAVISTTDFFTPIVDDPYMFGKIAAINAMSDVYAMGGKPIMAISILGWPLDKLSKKLASRVIEGATHACATANIMLAGGHSIDIPEPVFGLAVTGIIKKENIRRNNSANAGNHIFLSKPLGIGIMSTAAKKGIITLEDLTVSTNLMSQLNSIGYELGTLAGVRAMTDVTGFGLLGHLIEMCEGSNLSAEIKFKDIPVIEGIDKYISQKSIPGGTYRNWKSFSNKISQISERQKLILADPQTSGGLLIAITEEAIPLLLDISNKNGIKIYDIGIFNASKAQEILIKVV